MNRHIQLHPIPSENKPGGPKRIAELISVLSETCAYLEASTMCRRCDCSFGSVCDREMYSAICRAGNSVSQR